MQDHIERRREQRDPSTAHFPARTLVRGVRLSGPLLCGLLLYGLPLIGLPLNGLGAWTAMAQDVKDMMGRSQTQSQQKAVEDLIRKLQGSKPAAATPPAKAVPEAPQTAAPIPRTVPAPVPPPAVAAPVREPTKPQVATSPEPTPSPVQTPVQTPASPPEPRSGIPRDGALEARPAAEPPSPPPPRREPEPAPRIQPATAPSTPERVDTARIAEMPSVDIEIYFDYNSSVITRQSAATLSILAQALSDPRLAAGRFLIAGHTDAKGGAEFNRDLSERRAQSVRRFLIERFGIAQARLVAQGFGFDRLKVPEKPLDVQNRRVQVVNLTGESR